MTSAIFHTNTNDNETIDSASYKRAMRHLGSSACVITANYQDQKTGLTATSVTSVAAEPPELLVCINQDTSAWPLIEKSGCFGVNVLSTHQQQVALQFAGVGGVKGADRYKNANWIQHNGIWLLKDASAVFACEVSEIIIRHSHALVLGSVKYVHFTDQPEDPLLYWHGHFGTFQADQP